MYVPKYLLILEKNWTKAIKRDPRFILVKGREYFHGPWMEAGKLMNLP
jgi:hypothetical protein